MSIPARLMRTGLLLGEQGINTLQHATVMIIGVGAVGGYALEAIARAGVGHIIGWTLILLTRPMSIARFWHSPQQSDAKKLPSPRSVSKKLTPIA